MGRAAKQRGGRSLPGRPSRGRPRLPVLGIDVGGVEYAVDDRDGEVYYYDINALSNFVADAPRVIGFDPFVNLVDYLLKEAESV